MPTPKDMSEGQILCLLILITTLLILLLYRQILRMRATKTTHIFEVGSLPVKFTSNFDGGNLRVVTQMAAHKFLFESAFDSYELPVTNKSFFHFCIENYPINEQIHLISDSLALLQCLSKEQAKNYRPFLSLNGENYQRVDPKHVSVDTDSNPPTLHINYTIVSPIIYFSFALPYSYERYLNMVRDLPQSSESIYIRKEVLCYSNNLNLVYMISITEPNQATDDEETIGELSNGIILPEKHLIPKKIFFEKPVILISGRVHPGQTPASWAIEGIIKYVLGDSPQAQMLRRSFQIVVVPMLNPDGVYEGHYRLDTKGHNLNRYYLISDNRQPSIYSMKHLIRHYNDTKRLLYYLDFHGHPSYKGSFLYGNAIDDIAYQAQTQLFVKLLALNCPTFEQKYCIFDRQQMNSKDKYDMYTKQGCARVYAFKTSNILHSYTIEMGFHSISQSRENFFYGEEDYFQEGRAIMRTILESAGLKDIEGNKKSELRKAVAQQIHLREDRFRKEEKNLSYKRANVNEIIENLYWKPIYQRFFKEELKKQTAKTKSSLKSRHLIRLLKKDTLSKVLTISMEDDANCQGDKVADAIDSTNDTRETVQDPTMVQQPTIRPFLMEVLERSRRKVEAKSIIFTSNYDQRVKNPETVGKLARINLRAIPKQLNFSSQDIRKHDAKEGLGNRLKLLRRQGLPSRGKMLAREEESMFSDVNIRVDEKMSSGRTGNPSNEARKELKSLNCKFRRSQAQTLGVSDRT